MYLRSCLIDFSLRPVSDLRVEYPADLQGGPYRSSNNPAIAVHTWCPLQRTCSKASALDSALWKSPFADGIAINAATLPPPPD